MRGKLAFLLAFGIGACGQATQDSVLDASAGAAGTTSGGSIGSDGGGSGGVVVGGGGVPASGGGVLAGGSAGQTGGGGTGGTGACGGTDGGLPVACGASSECCADEFCDFESACYSPGYCAKRPKSCPGECDGACSCGGEWCSVCISQMLGHDAYPFGSYCMSDGGGPNLSQAELGQPCGYYSGVCITGLKCCYPCAVSGCQTACMYPDANGMCPTITPQ